MATGAGDADWQWVTLCAKHALRSRLRTISKTTDPHHPCPPALVPTFHSLHSSVLHTHATLYRALMMAQQRSPDTTNAVSEQTLLDIEHSIRSLESMIGDEHRAWTDHLTKSQSDGPHPLQRGTRIRTADDITQQLQNLDEQLKAYNIRVRAIRERGAVQYELTLEDLVDAEDAKAISTEMASSLTQRIIVNARLTLNAHGTALQKQEVILIWAFHALGDMARNIKRSFEAERASPDGCLWCLKLHTECMILMLKAMMARLGMKTERQRVISEFFEKVDTLASGDVNEGPSGQLDGPMSLTNEQEYSSDAGQQEDDVEMGEDHECRRDVGDRADDDDKSSNQDENMDEVGNCGWNGGKRQT